MKTYGNTRGLRNHNPGNLRPIPLPDFWKGQVGIDRAKGGPFSIFGDLEGQEADFWGIRACSKNFKSYQRVDKCNTIGKIIFRHAPPSDKNDTDAYIKFACDGLGLHPETIVSLKDDSELMLKLLKKVFSEEDGICPYPENMIRAAIAAS